MQQLDSIVLEQFHQDGYVAIPDVLTSNEVTAAREALSEMVADYVAAGADRPKHPLMQFEPGFDPNSMAVDPTEAELLVRKFMWFADAKPALGAFLNPDHAVIKIVSQLIGPNPIMFQDMALIKPAFIGSEKPWHQDNAYFSVAPLDEVCGVWIALDDAGIDNGCMHVLPGEHLSGPLTHHHGKDCEIAEDKLALDKVRAVPIETGGAMFFYGLLPHQTPPNRSGSRRRALQFHFRSATSKLLPDPEYDKIYAENGTPASCAAAKLGI